MQTQKETKEDILNSATKKELELELNYREKELEREERKKERIEIEERLKSKNNFEYFLKWVWIVLLNKTWKRVFFIIVILFFTNQAYHTFSDKINLKTDENNINTEVNRLGTLRKNIDSLLELKKVDAAEIALADLEWNLKIKNSYLEEQYANEMSKWLGIKLTYETKIIEYKDLLKNRSNSSKRSKKGRKFVTP